MILNKFYNAEKYYYHEMEQKTFSVHTSLKFTSPYGKIFFATLA